MTKDVSPPATHPEDVSQDAGRGDVRAGNVFKVAYPFMRESFAMEDFDGESVTEVVSPSWRPGCEYRALGPYGEDTQGFCHAEGKMELTVVEVFKPGKYPTRVFFTRQWITPDGKKFGKSNLRIMTLPAFKRRAQGWFAEPYVIDAESMESTS